MDSQGVVANTWKSPSLEDEPHVHLFDWSAFLLLLPAVDSPSIHLVGRNVQSGLTRVTSPVARVHMSGTRVITSSGRVYELLGTPGSPEECRAMMDFWAARWNAFVLQNVSSTLSAMSEQAFQVPRGRLNCIDAAKVSAAWIQSTCTSNGRG